MSALPSGKKLSRREAALVAHARRRAVAEFCDAATVDVYTSGKEGRLTMQRTTLSQLQALNVLHCQTVFTVTLAHPWL